jgi:two-component system, cell cycle response regulator
VAPPHLLLVEDDLLSRQIYSEWLTGFGYRVSLASSTEEALGVLARDRADLVITDLLLPGRDGVALLDEARRIDPEVDVVVITALEQVAPAVRALKAGAADYLVKPIPKDALELSTSRCLTARQLRRENQALRDQVALFERGRRVSAIIDRAELWPLALSTLAESLGAKAGLIATLDNQGTPSIVAEVQLPNGRSRELIDRLRTHFRALIAEDNSVRWIEGGSVAGLHEPIALVPCAHQGEVRSAGAFLLPALPPENEREVRLSRCLYLAHHIGLAQANATRFAQAEAMAHTDDLTGLRNDRALRSEIDRAIANRPKSPFSLLFLDLDHFKRINDDHGHLRGSGVLAEVGRVLRGCVRDIDTAARYGGDEFAVVLPGADSGEALKVAERIRRAIAEHPFPEDITLTVSIGVASYPEHGSDRDAILSLADSAMYRGKRAHRNVVYLAER